MDDAAPADGPPPRIRRGWLRALLAVPAFVAALVLFQLPLMIVAHLRSRGPGVGADPPTAAAVFLAALLAVGSMRRLVDRRSLVSLGLSPRGSGGRFLAGSLWGGGLVAAVGSILVAAGLLAPDPDHEPIGAHALLAQLAGLALAAASEELVVRGYVLSSLMESMNRYAALAASALLFGALHLPNPGLTGPGLVNVVLAGLLLGVYYVHRRDLWFPIGLHLGWNFTQGPVLGLNVSGVEMAGLLGWRAIGPDWWTGGRFGLEGSLLTTVAVALAAAAVHLRYRRPGAAP